MPEVTREMNRTLLPLLIVSAGLWLPIPLPAAEPHNPVTGKASTKGNPSTSRQAQEEQKTTGDGSKNSGKTYTGKASYYGGKWNGVKTASGEIYNQNSMTAAHRTLPFNTKVKVTNLKNGKSVVLRINNRGPFKKGRIIDVSVAAAKKLGMMKAGVVPAKVEVL